MEIERRAGWGALKSRAARCVPIDRATPLRLPPQRRDWGADDHRVHCRLAAVAARDLRPVTVNERGTGSEQFPPTRMTARRIDSSATGHFSSRRIEQRPDESVPVRWLTAEPPPAPDTRCTFRREHKARLPESCVQVLPLAPPLRLRPGGPITVAVEGTTPGVTRRPGR